MRSSTIVCLFLCALALLVMTEPAKGERFCGNRLAQFVALTCKREGKVSLKSRKYRIILYKFVRYIPDMSGADKRHLINMFSKRDRHTRSVTHIPAWMKELELADISEEESSLLERLIRGEISKARQHSSSKHHQNSRHRRAADIVNQCCYNECDIDDVRIQYCAAEARLR